MEITYNTKAEAACALLTAGGFAATVLLSGNPQISTASERFINASGTLVLFTLFSQITDLYGASPSAQKTSGVVAAYFTNFMSPLIPFFVCSSFGCREWVKMESVLSSIDVGKILVAFVVLKYLLLENQSSGVPRISPLNLPNGSKGSVFGGIESLRMPRPTSS